MPITISVDPNCLKDLPSGVIPRSALDFGPQISALVAQGSQPKPPNTLSCDDLGSAQVNDSVGRGDLAYGQVK